ncbi:hypothetical protein GMORB2_0487 [Geosmithia morbida]|uniref:DUF2415 domain-containing protein n=1 Tax=Geosmithia morbida TaxID=1094350 RepID=A0A9P4Z1A9_9HYPO|nr:uncharacterized protein GMORB2_0487 [Geosmithia morbida]KAF4126750.1 hypothetical protein GMORB2_0487 [Geosmithia morbida]
MAVRDEGLYYPTDTIISKKGRKHYRVPVRSQHWQLRSLISAEKRHIVYFPGGSNSNHVQRLNTQTRECETVKLLTFAPRCLAAADGWLCCGSEHGEFAAIRLDDDGANDDPDLDFDAGAPVISTPGGDTSIFSLLARVRRPIKSMIAKNVKLAKERVNCITLWMPPTKMVACDRAYPFPVAVLANNDRTVTLVNLDASQDDEGAESLDVISYPDFVNRAVISPDGRLLIAILDDPYLYVHERVQNGAGSSTRPGRDGCWKERQRILLKSQRKDDRSDSRGSFAACFSQSGAYLAIGTQHGTVSIFNASLLTEQADAALITTFTSSRPESGPGAIRDMAFCPGPFDILAWTEDRGHIGLADLRTNFVVRQIVDINAEADFEHIDVLDRNTVDPRLLDRRETERRETERRETNLPSSELGSSNTNANTSEVRRWATVADRFNSLNHPLTTNEMMVLEAIRGDRLRRERATRGEDETSAAVPSSRWSSAYPFGYTGALEGGVGDRGGQERNNRAVDDLLGNYRDQRDRQHDRVRTNMQLLREANERRQLQLFRGQDRQWMERLGETVAAMRNQQERQDPSYFSLLEVLQARERSSPTVNNNNNGNANNNVNDEEEDSDDGFLPVPRINQMVSRWEESAIRGTLAPDHGVFEVPPSPDNTAGLAWSDDGRTLFVGAQNGIYELHIDVQSRKLSPSIQPR